MGFTVREGRSGDMGAKHHASKGKSKKSNWDLMGEGKGKGSLKGDLDEKGVKQKEMSGKAGTRKGTERKTKKGAY